MRKQITETQLQIACREQTEHIKMVLQKHGHGSFASRHEVFGVLTEEYNELAEKIKKGDLESIAYELKDIAQVCIFALACIRNNGVDW